MADPKVTMLPNGPLLVEGGVPLVDGDGDPVPGGDKEKYALCRCGSSSIKPFCDATHRKIEFRG